MLTAKEVASYYEHLTDSYLKYGRDTYGWHYGVWRPGITDHPGALLQSNRELVNGLELTANSRVLDVGCGVGGFAVWAAREFGCRVTGISVCPLHLTFAWQLAAKREVGDLCEFLPMDMSSLDFPDNSFDLVVNQETMCHALDKPEYLQGVHRVLKPGGVWRGVEFTIKDPPLSPREEKLYREVRTGFYIDSLLPAFGVKRILHNNNYEEIEAHDLTDFVLPTARAMINGTRLHLALLRLGLDWLVFPRDSEKRNFYQGHVRAGASYSRGLLDGCFGHYLYSGQKR